MSEDLSGLGLVELLQRLEPVPLPPPVPLWPQTAAWIPLGGIVLALLGWIALRAWRRREANAYRRAALCALASAGDDPAVIAAILRRAALAGFPRDEVAGLHGDAWLAFLDHSYGGDGFRRGPGRVLARAPYAASTADPQLSALATQWLRRHRAGRRAPR